MESPAEKEALMFHDKRCTREEIPEKALHRFLHAAALRLGYKGLVLGDGNGRLISWAGEVECPEQVAMDGPVGFPDSAEGGMDSNPEKENCFIEALFTPSGTLFVTALGGRSAAPLRTGGTLASIRRILDI